MPRASKVSRSGRRAPPQAQAALFVAETEKPLKAATCAQHLPFVNDAGRIKEAPSSVSGTFLIVSGKQEIVPPEAPAKMAFIVGIPNSEVLRT